MSQHNHNYLAPTSMTPTIAMMSKSVNNGNDPMGIRSSVGMQSSSMIEKERRALEKIKARQKKDIE